MHLPGAKHLTDLNNNTASTSFLRTGWTARAGLEYAPADNWSMKIEYDYLAFGSQLLNFTTPVLGSISSNANLNVQEINLGVNFRFGGFVIPFAASDEPTK